MKQSLAFSPLFVSVLLLINFKLGCHYNSRAKGINNRIEIQLP